jgi:hypothetical protein
VKIERDWFIQRYGEPPKVLVVEESIVRELTLFLGGSPRERLVSFLGMRVLVSPEARFARRMP